MISKVTFRLSILNFIAWAFNLACGIIGLNYMLNGASLETMGNWAYYAFWVMSILFTLYGALPMLYMLFCVPVLLYLYFRHQRSSSYTYW